MGGVAYPSDRESSRSIQSETHHVGGMLSALFPFVEEDVRRRLAERHFPTVEDLEIDVSSFGKDSSALGGAALVFDRIFSVPDSSFLEDLDLSEPDLQ